MPAEHRVQIRGPAPHQSETDLTADGRPALHAGIVHTSSCIPASPRFAARWLALDPVRSPEKYKSRLQELLLALRSTQQLRLESLPRPFHRARVSRAPHTSTQTESSHPGYPPARFASFSVLLLQISLEPGDPSLLFESALQLASHLSYFLRLKYPMRSSTALAIKGSATVASSNTSAKRPPSSGGTNFPQETASVYVLPLKPPQWTGSGQIRTP